MIPYKKTNVKCKMKLDKWKLVTDVEALVKSSSAICERNGKVVGTEGFPPVTERGECA